MSTAVLFVGAVAVTTASHCLVARRYYRQGMFRARHDDWAALQRAMQDAGSALMIDDEPTTLANAMQQITAAYCVHAHLEVVPDE
jgi:hypothetical protein